MSSTDSLPARSDVLFDPEAYWAGQAECLLWRQRWQNVSNCSFSRPDVRIRWFEGGKLNVVENCLDRHLATRGDKPAIIWEPDDPAQEGRILTYRELYAAVMRCANMLLGLGVQAGDRVTIYLPMVPEAAIAMLACARIGAVHSVVFAGFSAQALRSRIEDCGSQVIITADGARRGGKELALKACVDEALAAAGQPVRVLVLKHTGCAVEWNDVRDVWWHVLEAQAEPDCQATPFDAEHPLFILYTSGSTGQPKGLLHSSAGYLLYASHTFRHVFDWQEDDIFWCSADVGWITGHSYIIYGPLAAGATTLMFEGVATYPDAGRFWQVVEKYRVSLFYTAPTAIRMLMREGDAFVTCHDRSSLRILGSVGEPINPEAWHWYHQVVGEGRCPIVDTWWQTETGGHMITPIPGQSSAPPGSASLPYYGIDAVLCDEAGNILAGEASGALCIRQSWPGQARSIWGDHSRFVETYFSAYPGLYFSGDAARRDAEGNFWIAGRMDDVVNVAGHRIGTAEVEAAINEHALIVESAVVGIADEIKGQALYAFVITTPDAAPGDALLGEVNGLLREQLGPIVSLKQLQISPGLPKTRSGKIMRRILRNIAGGEVRDASGMAALGDISTLVNPEVVTALLAPQAKGGE